MSSQIKKTKTLTDTGEVSGVGVTTRLMYANFMGVTAGDKLDFKDGATGGTVIFSLIVPANGFAQIGPFSRVDAPVFSTDLFVTFTKTGAAYANFIFEEIE